MARPGYHFRSAIGCLRQAPYATTIAVLTVAASLAFSGTALLGARAVESGLRAFATEARITVFVTADALADIGDAAIASAGHSLAIAAAEAAGAGASAEFLTPEAALAQLRTELGPMGTALDSLVENPLPPSIDVRLNAAPGRTLDDVHAIAQRLSALPFAGDVDYGRAFLDRVGSLLAFIRTAGLVLFAVVLGVTLFLVGNVVRLTVYARRDEIEILRLVGATDTFIATPFLLEGALQGFAGGVLASLSVVLAHAQLFPRITGSLGFGTQFQPPTPEPALLFGLVLAGIAVGVLASTLGVFRFLRSVR